jgi:hypothetical protein
VCSGFENRVLNESILGFERCRLAVITKRYKPATARLHGISWFSEPTKLPNTVSAEAEWEKIPTLWSKDGMAGRIAIPMHDLSTRDIARLLLKIGVELLGVWSEFCQST